MNKSYLEQLKEMVAADFDQAASNPASKEQIDKLAKQKQLIDGAMEELSAKDQELKEVLKSYSDAVAHQSFNDPKTAPTNNIAPVSVSFDEVLQQFIK